MRAGISQGWGQVQDGTAAVPLTRSLFPYNAPHPSPPAGPLHISGYQTSLSSGCSRAVLAPPTPSGRAHSATHPAKPRPLREYRALPSRLSHTHLICISMPPAYQTRAFVT